MHNFKKYIEPEFRKKKFKIFNVEQLQFQYIFS